MRERLWCMKNELARDRCKLWLVRRESTWSGTRVETHFQTNLSVITFTTRFNLRTNSNLICKFSVDFLALSKNYTRARKVSVFFNVSTTCTNEWFNSYYFFRSCFPFNNRGDSSKRELKWNEQNKINTWKTKKCKRTHSTHEVLKEFWLLVFVTSAPSTVALLYMANATRRFISQLTDFCLSVTLEKVSLALHNSVSRCCLLISNS